MPSAVEILVCEKKTLNGDASYVPVDSPRIENTAPCMITYIVPALALKFSFKKPLTTEAKKFSRIRAYVIRYLQKRPHELSRITSNSYHQKDFIFKSAAEMRWLCDGIAKEGLMVSLDEVNATTNIKHHIPVVIITFLFVVFVIANGYFETLVKAVDLPASENPSSAEKKADITMASFDTVSNIFLSFATYFVGQTLRNIDFATRKMMDWCHVAPYDIRQDFIVKTTCESLVGTIKNHPIKSIVISTLSVVIVGLTTYGAVMNVIEEYVERMDDLTKVHERQLSHFSLEHLIKLGMTFFFANAVINFLLTLELYSTAMEMVFIVYNALHAIAEGCKNKAHSLLDDDDNESDESEHDNKGMHSPTVFFPSTPRNAFGSTNSEKNSAQTALSGSSDSQKERQSLLGPSPAS